MLHEVGAVMQNDIIERQDWHLLLAADGLSQWAGVGQGELVAFALKELADNALDAGDEVGIETVGTACTISDDGPGLAPERVLAFFTVNRALACSKLWRQAGRGAMGMGLRVVAGVSAVFGGTITTVSHGTRLVFTIHDSTGAPIVLEESAEDGDGFRITLDIPGADMARECGRARIAARFSGRTLEGKADPRWFDAAALHGFCLAAPTVPAVRLLAEKIAISNEGRRALRDRFGDRTFDQLGKTDLAAAIAIMHANPGRVKALSGIGEDPRIPGIYRRVTGNVDIDGVTMPAIVEAWVEADRVARRDDADVSFALLLVNRTPPLAPYSGNMDGKEMDLLVSGYYAGVPEVPPLGDYRVRLAVAVPKVPLLSHSKAPDLQPFRELIEKAVGQAARAAFRATEGPRETSLKAAAYEAIPAAYAKASGPHGLPVNARQIFYGVRGAGVAVVDTYFTSVILPQFMLDHPDLTRDWKVYFDDRGNLTVPHEGRSIGLGTQAVERHLAETPGDDGTGYAFDPVLRRVPRRARLSGLLALEKEGFAGLLAAVGIAERFDVGILGAKGHSTTAARKMADAYLADGLPVVVCTDFDTAGIEIARVYAEGSWRDGFTARSVIRAGLRLADVERMGLQAEALPVATVKSDRHVATLARLLDTGEIDADERAFLETQRVELNAMTSDQMVAWLEEVLTEAGCGKVVPDAAMLKQAWRRTVRGMATEAALAEAEPGIAAAAAAVRVPRGLAARCGRCSRRSRAVLGRGGRPHLPDLAREIEPLNGWGRIGGYDFRAWRYS